MGGIWGATQTKPDNYGQDITLMPPTLMGRPIPGDQIARVARSFKELTCKPDGLHPRYFGWLSEPALEVVSLLFFIIDAIGDFPAQVQNVLIRLLDKPMGGKRPVGHFRAMFRVWAKLKKGGITKWEKNHGAHKAFSGGPG